MHQLFKEIKGERERGIGNKCSFDACGKFLRALDQIEVLNFASFEIRASPFFSTFSHFFALFPTFFRPFSHFSLDVFRRFSRMTRMIVCVLLGERVPGPWIRSACAMFRSLTEGWTHGDGQSRFRYTCMIVL